MLKVFSQEEEPKAPKEKTPEEEPTEETPEEDADTSL